MYKIWNGDCKDIVAMNFKGRHRRLSTPIHWKPLPV